MRRLSKKIGSIIICGFCLAFAAGPILSWPNLCWGDQAIRPGIVFPVLSPRLSSKFGKRIHPKYKYVRHHSGIDLAVPEKTHVRAVLGGRVVFAGVYAGYGKLVTIEHDMDDISMYGHLSEIRVNVGQEIKQGEIIGRVGSTGISTGPHLHFEWRHLGEIIDPLKVFPSLAATAEG